MSDFKFPDINAEYREAIKQMDDDDRLSYCMSQLSRMVVSFQKGTGISSADVRYLLEVMAKTYPDAEDLLDFEVIYITPAGKALNGGKANSPVFIKDG